MSALIDPTYFCPCCGLSVCRCVDEDDEPEEIDDEPDEPDFDEAECDIQAEIDGHPDRYEP